MNNYEYGYPFEVENPKSLAKAIERLVGDTLNGKTRAPIPSLKERFSVQRFVKKHEELYKRLLQKDY